jgi:hypothetical protein
MAKKTATPVPRPRICIDEDCPACGWPERWAILPTLVEPGPIFGCPKCDYTSERRDA